jgi:pyruvate/2-oxoglutarate dehydrogenase complex dihydrolipoamide acyltransferase (E2) component
MNRNKAAAHHRPTLGRERDPNERGRRQWHRNPSSDAGRKRYGGDRRAVVQKKARRSTRMSLWSSWKPTRSPSRCRLRPQAPCRRFRQGRRHGRSRCGHRLARGRRRRCPAHLRAKAEPPTAKEAGARATICCCARRIGRHRHAAVAVGPQILDEKGIDAGERQGSGKRGQVLKEDAMAAQPAAFRARAVVAPAATGHYAGLARACAGPSRAHLRRRTTAFVKSA